MYCYAVSLGGIATGHYLVKDDGNHPFSGVSIYGINLDPPLTVPHFKKTMWGIYDMGLGFFLNIQFRGVLNQIEKFASKK